MKKLILLLVATAVASLTLGCKQSKPVTPTPVEPSSTVSPLGYEVERFVSDSGKNFVNFANDEYVADKRLVGQV